MPCGLTAGSAGWQDGEEGEEGERQWVLEGVEAGAVVPGLAVQLLDGGGAPVAQPVEGRVKASWIPGSKKVRLAGASAVDLLPLTVRARAHAAPETLMHSPYAGRPPLT